MRQGNAEIGHPITFNVIFTRGSPERLLPFAWSLLRGSGVHVRLVANGCDTSDVDVLRRAADRDDRLAVYVLPRRGVIEHGLALNHLFDAHPDEPLFAFADSDVLATGDFVPRLLPLGDGQAGAFSAPPVWAIGAEDAVAPSGGPFLAGRMRELPDGTPVGGTYFAIYDRAMVEPAVRAAPRGFAIHHRQMLAPPVRGALAERGWDYPMLDTGRVVNLLLLLDGRRLENHDVPELHHVGGFSNADFGGASATLRRLAQMLVSKEARSLGIRDRARLRSAGRTVREQPYFERITARRTAVPPYARAVLDALIAGAPLPPPLRTGTDEVDRQVEALVEALAVHYPEGRARLGLAPA